MTSDSDPRDQDAPLADQVPEFVGDGVLDRGQLVAGAAAPIGG